MLNMVADQWLQFDIGPPTLVTGLVTKGRGDSSKKHWVTKFHVSYSNDSQDWHFYKENGLDIKVCSVAFNKVLLLIFSQKNIIDCNSTDVIRMFKFKVG